MSMNTDALVSGILIAFLGILLELQNAGIITYATMKATLPITLIIVGAIAVYVGCRTP